MDEENLYEEDFEETEPYRHERLVWRRVRKGLEEDVQETLGDEVNAKEIIEEISNIEALEDSISMEAEEPSFPFFTFYIALTLDLLGLVDFTGVGWFIMSIIEIIFSVLLFFLMFRKTNTLFKYGSRRLFRGRTRKRLGKKRRTKSGSPVQKILVKTINRYVASRVFSILLIKIVPIIGILGSDAFFVYLSHNKQKKMVRKYMDYVEKVTKILNRYYKTLG